VIVIAQVINACINTNCRLQLPSLKTRALNFKPRSELLASRIHTHNENRPLLYNTCE